MATGLSDRFADERAALHRVAALVAGGALSEAVFAAVAEEVGGLLGADLATVGSYDQDGGVTVLGAWSSTGATLPIFIGSRTSLSAGDLAAVVFRTRRPARIDDYSEATGPAADLAHGLGVRATVGAPISIEGRLWGVVVAASTRDQMPPPDTEARLAGFTEVVATAIANAQARVELRGHAEEQAALRRVATLVARTTSPEEVFTAVAEEIGRLLEVDFTILSRYEPEGMQVSVGVWSKSDLVPFPVGTRVRLGGRNVVSLVVESGRPARIDDYSEASGPVGEAARTWRLRSAVGVPIRVGGRLWGVISVASEHAQPMRPDTEARLAAFTELVATAVANAQARVELRGFAEEQAALRRVATLVARGAPPEEVFAVVTAEVGRVLGADFTTMSRYDAGPTITVLGLWSSTGAAAPVSIGQRLSRGGRSVTTLVAETGRPARLDYSDDGSGAVADAAREWGLFSAVGVPIDVEGRVWGIVTVGSTRERSLPANTEARLAGFTELVANALANAQARVELRDFAEEQAALRRVATLVARAAPPEDLFAAVTAEVGRVLCADLTVMSRYDAGGTATVVGTWTETNARLRVHVGLRLKPGGRNLHTMVFQARRPVRIDDYAVAEWNVRAAVGVPISMEGRLWGIVAVASTREDHPLPPDAEARLADFTELVATAIANADAQAKLTASRARIVATADTTRRRIERDLHDGAQQRLVSLALRLRSTTQETVPPGADALTAELESVATELVGVLDGLREIARGIHPSVLADGGLRPALTTLARRSAVPVRLDAQVEARLPEPVELAAYYVVAEALTNAAKHAHATVIDVEAATDDGMLRIRVRDDGRGGADSTGGSGLIGLADRVEALGGRIALRSPPGAGTDLQVVLPLTAPNGPVSPADGVVVS